MVSMTDPSKEAFCLEVERHECIYKTDMKEYRDNARRAAAWREIATQFEMTVEDCHKRWKCMRTQYAEKRRTHKKHIEKGTFDRSTIWPYFKLLTYLEPYMRDSMGSGQIYEMHSSVDEFSYDDNALSDTPLPVCPDEDNCQDQDLFIDNQHIGIKRESSSCDVDYTVDLTTNAINCNDSCTSEQSVQETGDRRLQNDVTVMQSSPNYLIKTESPTKRSRLSPRERRSPNTTEPLPKTATYYESDPEILFGQMLTAELKGMTEPLRDLAKAKISLLLYSLKHGDNLV